MTRPAARPLGDPSVAWRGAPSVSNVVRGPLEFEILLVRYRSVDLVILLSLRGWVFYRAKTYNRNF